MPSGTRGGRCAVVSTAQIARYMRAKTGGDGSLSSLLMSSELRDFCPWMNSRIKSGWPAPKIRVLPPDCQEDIKKIDL